MNYKKNKTSKINNKRIIKKFQKIKNNLFKSKIINSNSLIILILIILDQLVKMVVRKGINIEYSFVNIELVKNTGMVFGFFQGNSKIIAVISIIIVLIILMNQKRISETKEKRFSLLLIITGLLSNAIDRLILGAVTDFLCIGFWPCFNLADSYLVLGVFGYIIYSFRK